MATCSSLVQDNLLFYSRNIELSIALREIDQEYYISPKQWFTSYGSVTHQSIRVLWKPPAALMWVEKCTTERASGYDMSVEFETKAYFDVEEKDLCSTHLRFEIFGQIGTQWSSIETNLGRIVSGGVHGVQLPLQLELPDVPSYLASKQADTAPGYIHLRAEFVKSPAIDNLGVKLSMIPRQLGSNQSLRSKYILQLHKLNLANRLDHLLHPYTILCRDYWEIDKQQLRDFEPHPYYTNESRLTNGEMDRVMKIIICKRKNAKKKGFALFTISDLMKTPCQYLRVTGMNGNIMKDVVIELCLNLFPNLKILSNYMEAGLKFIRVYAVDFSSSNWDAMKHGSPLHIMSPSESSPYEEALVKISETMACLSDGESVFYNFGDDEGTDLASTFPNDNHTKRLIGIYRDSVYSSILKKMKVSKEGEGEYGKNDYSGHSETRAPKEGGPTNYPSVQQHAGPSRRVFSCVPQSCTLQSHSKTLRKNFLAPILQDILDLLCSRNVDTLEYFTAFILTDGDFCDIEKAIEVLIQLSRKPVSIIFIGIGSGFLSLLTQLDKCCTGSYPSRQQRIRKNTHLVHFRSAAQWNSSLAYYKVQSHPDEIFRKEILTVIRDQSIAYLRQHRPRI